MKRNTYLIHLSRIRKTLNLKRVTYLLAASFTCISCSSDFLNTAPKGTYHNGNYDMSTGQELLILATLMDGYNVFAQQTWPVTAMHCHASDNSHPGGPSGDGGVDFSQFPTMSFTASNGMFSTYYNLQFNAITKANEALKMLEEVEKTGGKTLSTSQYRAEAYFIRSAAYFRLTQAFGSVPYVDRVMGKEEEMADQLSASAIRNKYLPELIGAIQYLPTRKQSVSTGNVGRATQNAARAIIAKTYLYEKDYSNCLTYTNQIINSGDNDLTTPYTEIFREKNEFGPESIWEVNADFKPDQNISIIGDGNQWCMMNGVRGFPNLGWGHNAPSQDLMNDYEKNDPRFDATILKNGDQVDGDVVVASDYKYFNKKAYCPKSERSGYGRADWCYGYWSNLLIIRYADILLMHAEAACEANEPDDAKEKLEWVRERARNGNIALLPKIRTNDKDELREKIRHERRIELALEFERYFDLVRWGIAKDKINGFVEGKHELFPLPQTEIDKSNGKLQQNPKYN